MAQKRTKIHHYVPKALQRYFCCAPEKIWFTEKSNLSGFSEPELRNIESTFKQRDYYTVLEGDAPSDKVEVRFYQKLDDYLGKFLKEISEIFDCGQIPRVSDDQLESFQKLAFQLIKRVPDFMKKYDDLETGREVMEETLSAVIKANDPNGEESEIRQQLEDEKFLKRVGRHVRVGAQVSRSDLVEGALKDFQIKWVEIKDKHSFVLPSQIIYRIGNGYSNGISNESMEMWMPISPKRILVMLRDRDNKIPLQNYIDREKVREINLYGVRNSMQVASHSKELLLSLLKQA